MGRREVYIDIDEINNKYKCRAFCINGENDEDIYVNYAGKDIISMSVQAKKERVYQILDKVFNVKYIFDDDKLEAEFYPLPLLYIFATDSEGGYYCSTKVGFLDDEYVPIYYIDKNLKCFNIVDNIRQLLGLVVYYPNWKSILYENKINIKEINNITSEQQELIDLFKLVKDENLINNIKSKKSNIKLYSSKEEAEKENEFYDISKIEGKI